MGTIAEMGYSNSHALAQIGFNFIIQTGYIFKDILNFNFILFIFHFFTIGTRSSW